MRHGLPDTARDAANRLIPLFLALGLSACSMPEGSLGTGWDMMKQDTASGLSNAKQLAGEVTKDAEKTTRDPPPTPPPGPWTAKEIKNLLVAQRAAWVLVNPGAVRDARIGPIRKDWFGNTVVCVGVNLKDASGRYTGLRPRNVVISPDHMGIGEVYEPTQLDPCSLDETQPFPELNGPTAKK